MREIYYLPFSLPPTMTQKSSFYSHCRSGDFCKDYKH